MTPAITILYAGLLGILMIVLAILVGAPRSKAGVSVGDGGDPDLLLAIRRHANFIENVPMILVLLALMEMNGAPGLAIHVLGGLLVVSRIAHALGLKTEPMVTAGRLVGAGGTTLITLVASVWCIWLFVA